MRTMRLKQIKEAEAAATPGPWAAYSLPATTADGPLAGNIAGPTRISRDRDLLFAVADAVFIADARTWVPELVARVEYLERELETAQAAAAAEATFANELNDAAKMDAEGKRTLRYTNRHLLKRIAYLEAENARLSTTAAGWTYDDVMKQRRELETARLAEAAYAHESTTTIAKQAERIMQLEAWLKKACAGAAEILMAEISRVSYLETALRWLRDGPGSKGLWADGERKQIAADALAGRWEEKKA